jgi:hypothetical protein
MEVQLHSFFISALDAVSGYHHVMDVLHTYIHTYIHTHTHTHTHIHTYIHNFMYKDSVSTSQKTTPSRYKDHYLTGLWRGLSGGSNPGRGGRFFSSSNRPDRLWGPPSLLLYVGFFRGRVKRPRRDFDQ